MALPTLDSDLGIIAALPDEPNDDGGLTATQLKAKFDEAANKIQTYLNDTHLPEHTAEKISATPFTGIESENVQAALEELYGVCRNAVSESIPTDAITTSKILDGAVTEGKLGTEILVALGAVGPWILLQAYESAGTFTFTVPDLFNGENYDIGIFIVGGGGSGGAAKACSGTTNNVAAVGGASGKTRALIMRVTPTSDYAAVAGAGGAAVETATSSLSSVNGQNGGTSSFNGETAEGGFGGGASYSTSTITLSGADGGQGSTFAQAYSVDFEEAPAMGVLQINENNGNSYPSMAINPFSLVKTLGAGGGSTGRSSGSSYIRTQTVPTLEDGFSAGAGVSEYTNSNSVVGNGATSPGSGGGGACLSYNDTYAGTATSGIGAAGAVYIYARRADAS